MCRELIFFAMLSAMSAFSAEIRCVDVKDVWLSCATRDEAQSNGGKAPRIKLKVLQEFGLFDFDVSALKGNAIDSASLFLAPDGGERFAPGRGSDLRWFSVSTVSSPWEEGEGVQYTLDEKGHGATFSEASYKTRPWTVSGSKCWDVILGNGNSLRCDVDAGNPVQGWFEIRLDKRLLQALVANAAHGLAVLDGSTGVDRNSYVASRDGKRAPYLLVRTSGDDSVAPHVPGDVKIVPAPNEATVAHGALEIALTVPDRAFAFHIKLDGQPLPRWQIPFAAKAGTRQTFAVRYLPPNSEAKIEIAVASDSGTMSPFVAVTGRSSPAITVPQLPKLGAADTYRIPFTLDHAPPHLSAARGEIVSLPLRIEFPGKNIQIQIKGLDGVGVKLWRGWFVKSKLAHAFPDYAIPVNDALPINSPDDKNGVGSDAWVEVDLSVPSDFAPGVHHAICDVLIGGDSHRLPFELNVHTAVIPAEIHFNPELNAYEEPGSAGSARFFDAHRLAHYHRCSINSVPYSQRGDLHAGVAPAVGRDGHVTDWSAYDKNIGPLLDGSAFKDNPRSGVPVAVAYLPLSENYPAPMKPNYAPGCAVNGPDWKPKHNIFAKPPEDAFSRDYQAAFRNCAADFARHFEEKQYTRTLAECFFNNKWSFFKTGLGGTAWTMDEPDQYLDWHALQFYSRLFHDGIASERKTARLVFRGDISRPMWQGNCMDGMMEVLCANNEQFQMPQIMRDRRRMPTSVYAYGEANGIDRSNLETVAWCLKAWCNGCDGVLPWQSLGDDSAFDIGDKPGNGNALIVDGSRRFGVNAIASFRVHAFRDGAQLCELLRLLEIKKGWSRAHSGALVSQVIPLGAEFKQGFADDAAPLKFDKLDSADFVRLKEGILGLLDK
jgi:hypothetical protein